MTTKIVASTLTDVKSAVEAELGFRVRVRQDAARPNIIEIVFPEDDS